MFKVYKNKQYFIFKFEDGKTVKYNLSNGECIGKNNKVVKSLNNQLRGYTIQDVIDNMQDENYQNFLNFVNKEVNTSTQRDYWGMQSHRLVKRITNIGSFLSYIPNYSMYEQYFACGLKNIKISQFDSYREKLNCNLSEIPKGLIKLGRKYNIEINRQVLRAYKAIPDIYNNVMSHFNELQSINIEDIETMLRIYGNIESDIIDVKKLGTKNASTPYLNQHYGTVAHYDKFRKLVVDYNYNLVSLIKYLDNLMTYEAIDNFEDLCTDFCDYVKMSVALSDKYEKYPRYFLSTHCITLRNYNRLQKEFNEKKFQQCIKPKYEYQIDDYKFIYPKCTQDIKDEAVQQSNCVASYIDYVLAGDCDIMFLRKCNKNLAKNEQYNTSLVTLEIRNNKVVQARGKYNRICTQQEKELIKQFNEHLKNVA